MAEETKPKIGRPSLGDKKRIKYTVNILPDMSKIIEQYCAEKDIGYTKLFEKALTLYLKDYTPEQAKEDLKPISTKPIEKEPLSTKSKEIRPLYNGKGKLALSERQKKMSLNDVHDYTYNIYYGDKIIDEEEVDEDDE